MIKELELDKLLDREIKQLSGGELQRFACAMICVQVRTRDSSWLSGFELSICHFYVVTHVSPPPPCIHRLAGQDSPHV